MDLYLIVGGVVLGLLVLFVVFIYAALQMLGPESPDPLDPETRAQLARMQMRGVRRQGEAVDGSTHHTPASRAERRGAAADGSTHHAPASRSQWEGGRDDVA